MRKKPADQKIKKLYRLDYNWFGEVGTIYRHAYNRGMAWYAMSRILAKKYDTSMHRVYYTIKEGQNAHLREVEYE